MTGTPRAMKLARQPQVEVGKVDEHGRVGPAPFGLAHDLAKAAIDGRDVPDDLDDADFGDFSRVDQQLAAGLAHLLAANAKELDGSVAAGLLRGQTAQSLNQLCAIELAGSFAGGDQDSHGLIMTGCVRDGVLTVVAECSETLQHLRVVRNFVASRIRVQLA